jgi:hypothetical protein
MARLGGSPLGLIGVLSTPTRDGMSTFNGGRSRNINVNLYNAGKETDKEKLAKTNNTNGGLLSVFTGGNVIRPWSNIGTTGKEDPSLGIDQAFKGVARRTLHNNDVYDTSVLNLIEKLAGTSAALRPSDFAYLKKVGVYSNNRLVIARRFGGPMTDDIFSKGKLPLAVMMTWRTESEDFLEISFGEQWTEAKADFTTMLNELSKDFMGGNAGGVAGAAANAVPLPGFTEILVRKVLTKLGIMEEGSNELLPAGNPNLIKEAKRRKTVPQAEAGSGLNCTVSIKMDVEYEQKFISGIDPTIVFQDILANAVRFGTSPSSFYGLSAKFGQKILQWADNPASMITDFVNAIKEGVTAAKDEILKEITDKFKELKEQAAKDDEAAQPAPEDAPSPEPETNVERVEREEKEETNAAKKLLDSFIDIGKDVLQKTVGKYKVEIEGIVKALSGAPSTPWHVTIGNPLRPMFCSGDMYMNQDVVVNLGPTLAFNDLPSSIKVSFTLTNARPWGAQEIMSKFNTGNLRSVNLRKDSNNVPMNESVGVNNLSELPVIGGSPSNPVGSSVSNPDAAISNNANNTGGSPSTPGSGAPSTTTKENQDQPTVNSNPNSPNPPVEGESKPNPAPPAGQSQSNTGTSDFTIIGETLIISPTTPVIYAVTGTYSVAGKEIKGRGGGRSEDKARSEAREDAKKQAGG